MKLQVAELLFCEDFYQVLLWFAKFYEMKVPSPEHFSEIMSNPDIMTIGIWLDSCGTLATLKWDRHNYIADFFQKCVELPPSAESAGEIFAALAKYKYGMPPRITLWTTTTITTSLELSLDLARFLEDRGFCRDFSNNWDYFGS